MAGAAPIVDDLRAESDALDELVDGGVPPALRILVDAAAGHVGRVGVGKVKLAMTIEKPKIPEASQIEPATGHALRKFLLEQEYIDDMAKVIWLQRFAGVSFIGDMDEARALLRAMVCQLAAFHSPADLQIGR